MRSSIQTGTLTFVNLLIVFITFVTDQQSTGELTTPISATKFFDITELLDTMVVVSTGIGFFLGRVHALSMLVHLNNRGTFSAGASQNHTSDFISADLRNTVKSVDGICKFLLLWKSVCTHSDCFRVS
jgi:hypothetical protein